METFHCFYVRVESAFGQFVKHLNEPAPTAIDVELGNVEIFDFPITESEPILKAEPEWNPLVADKSVEGDLEKCPEAAEEILPSNQNEVNVEMSSLKGEVDGFSDKNDSGSYDSR